MKIQFFLNYGSPRLMHRELVVNILAQGKKKKTNKAQLDYTRVVRLKNKKEKNKFDILESLPFKNEKSVLI